MQKTGYFSSFARLPAIIYAIILGILGLILIGGGGYLLFLGGSPYYLLMGLGLLLTALVFANRAFIGSALLVIMTVLTVFWALWESGLHYWALFPRLFVPFILATIGLFLAGLAGPWRKIAVSGGLFGAFISAVFFSGVLSRVL